MIAIAEMTFMIHRGHW